VQKPHGEEQKKRGKEKETAFWHPSLRAEEVPEGQKT